MSKSNPLQDVVREMQKKLIDDANSFKALSEKSSLAPLLKKIDEASKTYDEYFASLTNGPSFFDRLREIEKASPSARFKELIEAQEKVFNDARGKLKNALATKDSDDESE